MNSQHNTDIALKKSLIEKKLEESGEKQRLEEYLRQKLIECGWKDELKKYCLDLIRSKGLEKINLDDLVEELLPKGRALVPTKIKEDLLARIKTYLENDSDYKRLTGY
ncbi:UNKNOWN [Stylonychia lemnae]|uniref:Transcription and mRNA export factor ENY2 n=1 Tax=Stylonychia lemnae TaxID=5949 RepID=A0A077ZWU6_STYLE|nr:UNKNOWN [Stylonychia lemnae]|eukprot:403339984